MNKWWLSLLLVMPMVCSAETTAPESAPVMASIVEPSAAVDDSMKNRPTLVEKLKAQESALPKNASPAWGNMVLGLSIVLALILGMAWLTKRLRMRVPGMAAEMKILEILSLGPREKICIVSLDGKRLLLGVTQHSINVLHTAEDDRKNTESEAMFSEKIKKMLQNGTSNGR